MHSPVELGKDAVKEKHEREHVRAPAVRLAGASRLGMRRTWR